MLIIQKTPLRATMPSHRKPSLTGVQNLAPTFFLSRALLRHRGT